MPKNEVHHLTHSKTKVAIGKTCGNIKIQTVELETVALDFHRKNKR